MAKKRSVNKSKLVLEYWNQHPKATAAEVSQALKNQGVSVSVTYIYGIKAKSKQKVSGKKAASQGVPRPQVKRLPSHLLPRKSPRNTLSPRARSRWSTSRPCPSP